MYDVEYSFKILADRTPVQGVTPFVKMGAYLDIKSSAWYSEDGRVSKFKILGYNIEDEVGVVSDDLSKLDPSASIQSNINWLVSLCLVIYQSILVSTTMISLVENIIGIS